MATWSTKRKYGYLLGAFTVVALVIGLPVFLTFYKAPTCFDGKLNGSERGVDCGGACSRLCSADFSAPKVLWTHAVRVVPGVYNALAYIQNPNQSVEARSIPYLFKFYDAQGLLIASRKGSAFIPAGQKLAVFEGGIQTGERVPVKTTFEFNAGPNWQPGKALTVLKLLDINLDQGTRPKAEVRVRNESVSDTFSGVSAFIILYDANDNRVGFSKTVIDRITPGQELSLSFTWPEAFSAPILRSEVLFVANP